MLGTYMQPRLKPAYKLGGKFAYRRRMRPVHLSLAGFITALLTFVFLGNGIYGFALLGIFLNRYIHGVQQVLLAAYDIKDEAPTFKKQYSIFIEQILNHTFYIGCLLFVSLGQDGMIGLGAFMITCYSIHAASNFFYEHLEREYKETQASGSIRRPLISLVDGTETVGILALMCLIAPLYPALAGLFSIACLVSVISKILELRLLNKLDN